MCLYASDSSLLRNIATLKHCHHFQHLHLYTFKGEEGQKKCMFCMHVKMMIIMDDPYTTRRELYISLIGEEEIVYTPVF